MKIERTFSSAARWSRKTVSFTLVLALTAVAMHRFGYVETIPFFWLVSLVGILAGIGVALGVLACFQMWEHGMIGVGSATYGILVGALILVPFGIAAARHATYPPLTDVMTDLAHPPQFTSIRSLRQPPMNPITPPGEADGVAHLEAYPELAPRRYAMGREQVMQAVLILFERRGWTVVSPPQSPEQAGSITLEAQAQTFLLGLPFDVAVRLDDRSDATYVDMRSASRYGTHDLGENAMQIQAFFRDLDVILSETAGG